MSPLPLPPHTIPLSDPTAQQLAAWFLGQLARRGRVFPREAIVQSQGWSLPDGVAWPQPTPSPAETPPTGTRSRAQVFTPPHTAAWMAARARCGAHTGRTIDIAAGTGRLLLAALRAHAQHTPERDPADLLEAQLAGLDRDPRMVLASRAVLALAALDLGAQRLPTPRIAVGDALDPNAVRALGPCSVALLNPPYANADTLSDDAHARLGERWAFHRRQLDLSALFMAASLDALDPGGRMVALVPRYWLEATHAAAFRAWLTERAEIRSVSDLGDVQLWPRVNVLTLLISATRRPALNPTPEVRFWRAQHPNDLDALWSTHPPEASYTVPSDRLGAAPWLIRSPSDEALLERLERAGEPLGRWCEVGQGLKTGRNAVFIMERARAEALGLPDALLRPTIAARAIRAHTLRPDPSVMLRILDDTDIQRWPMLVDWLSQHRDVLSKRHQAKHGACAWFALALPQNLAWMDAPKILTPLYARTNRFALDRVGRSVTTGVYMIRPRAQLSIDPAALVALLNSAPLRRVVQGRAKLKRAGYREFAARLLTSLPLPLTSSGALRPLGADLGALLGPVRDQLTPHAQHNPEAALGALSDLIGACPDDEARAEALGAAIDRIAWALFA